MSGMGMTHLYIGNGKGKTTAAIGLCVRASGYGFRVVFAQFLKGNMSGERNTLARLDNITVLPVPENVKFWWSMSADEKENCKEQTVSLFKTACRQSEKVELIVLDELLDAISAGALDESLVLAFLNEKPAKLEVVITGRNPSEAIIGKADYVSHIECIKHPYYKGIPARRGIEY